MQIGKTPLIRLERLHEQGAADIYVKWESANSTARRESSAASPSGANVIVASQQARKLGRGKRVVTIICDSGLKYLQGGLFN